MANSETNVPPEEDDYARFRAGRKIGAQERLKALSEYIAHYEVIAKEQPQLLNQKLPRKVVHPILDGIGSSLKTVASQLTAHSDIQEFLRRNEPPICIGHELTDEVRIFCLLLNALRQWTVAEQSYMDRFLFSGNVRKEIRKLATRCPVSSERIGPTTKVELHHPVRDGRPPLPLSKNGHDKLEGFVVVARDDKDGQKLVEHRRSANPPYSWKKLRVGCLDHRDETDSDLNEDYLRKARAVLGRVRRGTAMEVEQIWAVLDRYDLGSDEEG
jgi:hypothetical protein